MMLPGCVEIIDISSCQGVVDFDALDAARGPDGERVEGVITKISEGNADFPDAQFMRNWPAIVRIDRVRGGYRFAHPDMVHARDAIDEAERNARIIERAGGFRPGLDFHAVDIEEARAIPFGEPFLRWIVDGCERTDELLGSREGCYVGGPFLLDHGGKNISAELLERLRRRWHWLPAYVGAPDRFVASPWVGHGEWRIWQESGDIAPPGQSILHLAGIGGGKANVDRDFFRGTAADLRAWVASLDLTNAAASEPIPSTERSGEPVHDDGPAHPIGVADRAEQRLRDSEPPEAA